MDRRCVLNWLNEVYVTPSRAFDEYTEDELKMFAHDALVLLEEQEPAKVVDGRPRCRFECGNCGTEFAFVYNYCPSCGRKVDWNA